MPKRKSFKQPLKLADTNVSLTLIYWNCWTVPGNRSPTVTNVVVVLVVVVVLIIIRFSKY